MKIITCLTIVLAAVSFMPATASAGVNKEAKKEAKAKEKEIEPDKKMPKADYRIEKMRLLIEKGTKNGKLTKAESDSLTRELEGVERREEQYRRSMDKVTEGERKKLNRDITDLHQRLEKKVENGATGEPTKKS